MIESIGRMKTSKVFVIELGLTEMRVATKPALTRGKFSPPLWTPDLFA